MAIIEIGSTKQLFVDDYLIESLANAKQGLNQAVKADDNPVLRRERPLGRKLHEAHQGDF